MNGEGHSGRDRHGSHRDGYRDERRDRDRDRDRRRRSRSPGHRSSRRERDYEVDTYSSSRDHREREREDRYANRDRHRDTDRPDRGWDRERAGQPHGQGHGHVHGHGRSDRRERRDDDGRRERGDRAGPEDRRRAAGRNEVKKSASPPPKKKEPTPDLTDTVSVLDRKRRLTQWDIKPPGYENVTAEQAKLSGMFPLPGAPRQQVMDPSRLQAFMNQPSEAASAAALKPSNARQSKRLFIKNLPHSTTEESLVDFFNLHINGMNVISGPDPCLSVQIAKDKSFGMMEFRQPEDATVALALDGIATEAPEGSNGTTNANGTTSETANGATNGTGAGLIITRPEDYIGPSGLDDVPYIEGQISETVKDSPNKLSITHISPYFMEAQIKELLVTFGALKAFVLVKDSSTEQSRGIAFCEYVDDNMTDVAVMGLNGMSLGEEKLVVKRASVGVQQVSGLEMGVNAMSMLAGTQSTDLRGSRVIQLLNMVTADELVDNDEYEEICQDVQEECEKFGKVVDTKVPRPSGTRTNPGVGKIFVKFDTQESAHKALQTLAGRKFADRTVVVTFFGEEYFDVNAW